MKLANKQMAIQQEASTFYNLISTLKCPLVFCEYWGLGERGRCQMKTSAQDYFCLVYTKVRCFRVFLKVRFQKMKKEEKPDRSIRGVYLSQISPLFCLTGCCQHLPCLTFNTIWKVCMLKYCNQIAYRQNSLVELKKAKSHREKQSFELFIYQEAISVSLC